MEILNTVSEKMGKMKTSLKQFNLAMRIHQKTISQDKSVLLIVGVVLIMGIYLAYSITITGPATVLISLTTVIIAALFLLNGDLAVFLLVAYIPFHQVLVAYLPGSLLTGWKDLLIVFFVAFWILRKLYTKKSIMKSPLDWLIISFLVILVINLVRAPNLMAGLVGMKWYANFVPLYFVTANISVTKRKIRSLMLILLVAGAINGLYGLGLIFGPEDMFRLAERYSGATQIGSTYAAHWMSGTVWTCLLIIGVCLLGSPISRGYKLVISLCLIILFTATIFSLIRIAWVSLLFGFGFLAFLKRKRLLLYPLIAAIAVFTLFPPYVTHRATSLFDPLADISIRNKLFNQIPQGLKLIAMNPFGYGLGSITSINYSHLIGTSAVSIVAGLEQGFLEVGTETGLPGLFVYLAILLYAIFMGIRIHRKVTDAFLKAITAAIVSICFMVFVGEMLVPYLKTTEALYWSLLGLLVAIERSVQHKTLDQNQGGGG